MGEGPDGAGVFGFSGDVSRILGVYKILRTVLEALLCDVAESVLFLVLIWCWL